MKCEKCGAENKPGSKFCGKCGNKLNEVTKEEFEGKGKIIKEKRKLFNNKKSIAEYLKERELKKKDKIFIGFMIIIFVLIIGIFAVVEPFVSYSKNFKTVQAAIESSDYQNINLDIENLIDSTYNFPVTAKHITGTKQLVTRAINKMSKDKKWSVLNELYDDVTKVGLFSEYEQKLDVYGEDLIDKMQEDLKNDKFDAVQSTYQKLLGFHFSDDLLDKGWDLNTKAAKEKEEYRKEQERKKKEAAEKKRKEAFAKLDKRYDKVQDVTWYESPSQPYYTDIRSYVLPYIGKSGDSYWMKLRFLYTGNSWIFFDNVEIYADGQKFYKSFDYYEMIHDNDTEVWEYIDINPTDSDIEMLKAMANANETIVRFKGQERQYDLTISSEDKRGIKNVVNAYELVN